MNAPRRVRFGILGAGVIADHHRRAIVHNAALGADLVAIGHHDASRFDAIAARHGVPCIGSEALLAHPDIDVVCLCTPSGRHAAQAIAAAERGKHVLVEKPMATTVADADAMIAACAAAGVLLGVVLQRRSAGLFRRIREAVAAGDLGALTLGVVTMPYHRPQDYFERAAWRGSWGGDGGGVLMNQGIHLVDLLVWFMGDPVAVQAFADTLQRDIEVEDTLAATLRFGTGALATIAATTAAIGSPHRIELYGTAGTVQVEGEHAHVWRLAAGASARVPPTPLHSATDAAGGDSADIDIAGHVAIVRDFLEAVQDGRRPLVDGAEGRRSLAAIEAIYRAAGLVPR